MRTDEIMMKIDNTLLDSLSASAKESPRLRMNLDLRNGSEDRSQRMLNALEPGTVLPVHRHPETSESVVILRGALKEIFFDDGGNITEEIVLKPGSGTVGVQIPAGQWHTVECLEPGTVLLEAKDGPYHPLDDNDILNR